MRCSTIQELPPSPSDKTGWPWTEESAQLADTMTDGNPWPKLSIVTPSYNQGQFIEETIRSVLLQGYPNLEYIIIDGGSSDNSVDIIKKYEQFLAFWASEPDKGQSHAVNKGIEISSGHIIGWINSDDVYSKDAFKTITDIMWKNASLIQPIVYGGIDLVDDEGRILQTFPGKPLDRKKLIAFWRQDYHIPQPTVFFQSDILKKNKLNDSLHYAMDWELYLRLSDTYPFYHLPQKLVRFRSHGKSKTSGGWGPFSREQIIISKKYWGPNKKQFIFFWLDYNLWPITRTCKEFLGLLRKIFRVILGVECYEKIKALKVKIFLSH
ncbi:MAG: glycosyltransferase family 2 protein [bacterium]